MSRAVIPTMRRLTIAAGWFLFAALSAGAQDEKTMEREIKRFITVFAKVAEESAEPVDASRAFYEGAIPGMLRKLDPHSVFFDPGQFNQLQEMERSERKGFGTVVSVLPGRVIVLQAMAGTPSARAGLGPGDEIVAINGIALAQLEFEQLVQLLGESRQKEARLDVLRPGNARLMTFVLNPALMDSPSVDRSFHLAPGIGYMRVTSFDGPTGKLIADTINQLGGSALRGLVIDLRNNPGGVAASALEAASLFLKPETRILSIKGRPGNSEDVAVPEAARPYDFRVAVLVNERSASASEILAGALQDHGRATVIGQRTYGKGLVQRVFPLAESTGLALTVAFYYTPKGRSLQRPLNEGGQLHPSETPGARAYGIQPDFIVYPEAQSRLQLVLDASGAVTTFAGEYVQGHEIGEKFEVTGALLDEFQAFLSARRIRPGVSEWLQHREWIQSRLAQEIVTLKQGVAKGDELELMRDPVVKRAIEVLQK